MYRDKDSYAFPSLEGLREFAASKDPQETYEWTDSARCACAQYSHANGMKGAMWRSEDHYGHSVWNRLNVLANDLPGMAKQVRHGDYVEWQRSVVTHTFGDLHKRLLEEV